MRSLLLSEILQNRLRTKEGQEGARFKELHKQLEQLREQLDQSQQKLTTDEQSLQQVGAGRLAHISASCSFKGRHSRLLVQ